MRRGFKTESKLLAEEIRRELDISWDDPLDPHALADHLAIPVWTVSDFACDFPGVGYLLDGGSEHFSAVTVFAGKRRTIVHNDAHAEARQHSNLAHELAHGLLAHPPTPALDNKGCREWNQDFEDEAAWLGADLLVTESAALAIARGRWTKEQAAVRFQVSPQMIQFRLNATGAVKRAQRQRKYRSR